MTDLTVVQDAAQLTVAEVAESLTVSDDSVTVSVTENAASLVVQEAANALTVAAVGPAGPPGAPGPAGGDVFVHTQSTPAATWVIDHDRGRRVHVSLLNDSDEVVFSDIEHGSLNQTTITFPAPTTGVAIIS